MNTPPKALVSSAPPGTVWFGGSVDLSQASLRVRPRMREAAVDLAEISQLLGVEPNQTGRNHWSLRAPDSEGGNIDAQVDWLLTQLTQEIPVWQRLGQTHRMDIFFGIYLTSSNQGVGLSAKSMLELGQRGIEAGFDIYAEKPEP
jgi:hypothetical protein